MREDAEEDGVARLAAKNDDRITPIGKFIRSCRIDELPQLFNILAGDMSFIGPRPERPEIIEQYLEEMPDMPKPDNVIYNVNLPSQMLTHYGRGFRDACGILRLSPLEVRASYFR
jgi:hypothetical protein